MSTKHWGKWNSRMSIFYIWLLCHVLLCFVLYVGVCVHKSLVFVMKLNCEDGECVLEMVCGKLAPCHVTERYLAHPRSWLGNTSWGVFLAFPQLFPSVIKKKKKEERCAERKVCLLPISIDCSTHGTNFGRMQCNGLIQLGKDHKTPLQTLV